MRLSMKALSAAVLFAGFGLNSALALPPAPKADEMARVQPKQAGVEVTTLAAAQVGQCRVEPFPNSQAPVGYVLLDAANKPVRRFVAVNTPNFNIFSFYLDGEEVYRETDSKGGGKADQFRWLGAQGSKTGRDLDGNGSIDTWETISPEEVSKEIFEAIVAKDANRLKALQPTAEEVKSLNLSPALATEMQNKIAQSNAKFQNAVQTLALTNKAKWVHAEMPVPETIPSDAFGGTQDLVRYRNGGGVLVDKGDGKVEPFSTGELVKIGNAWRVIEGPSAGNAVAQGGGANSELPPGVRELLDELLKIQPGTGPKYHTDRAAILEKIVPKFDKHPNQEEWMRQMIDAHASAAELGDKPSYDRLNAWKGQIEKFAAKQPIHAYVTFRTLNCDFILKLNDAKDQKKMAEVQKWWRDELDKFVTDHANSEEAAEGLFRLAMAWEFESKAGEEKAVGFYKKMADRFPNHPQAATARGAAARLTSEGKNFAIAGCVGISDGVAFNNATLKGKVVLVHFWGSFAMQGDKLKADAAEFAALQKKYGKMLEIVTISLDTDAKAAVAAINAVQLPGTHLASPNGQMPTAWGIMGQHIFLLDISGKVENKNVNLSMVGDEIEKLVK